MKKLAEIAGFKPKEMMGNIRVWQRRVAYWVLWQPHLRIEQAMIVAEAMIKNGYCPGIIYDDNGKWAMVSDGTQPVSGGPGTYAFFVDEDTVWANTPAEAICSAALAAKEG